ncbi:cellulose biosynthesis protein BcsQ [Variovorax ginsengisoli]|uniref:Cellulose synthase operon protein YhjQ n=1 Tax=Variovorax ginsengisoli TaxID=363844 RepID=A0ABT9S9P2_9BURK|nr:cellulose biosynthesis protein BcsQ [Variovorax ginsengisoli]MDP9900451.1 cellulose synthase operon protein YhjQ [Variovorax ginsengisoli]
MRIVAVIAAKGGVGKTTVTANLCTTLAEAGHQVLAIDLDPQNALRFHLCADVQACETGLAQAISGEHAWMKVIQPARSGVLLLPFGAIDDERQFEIEQYLASYPNWLGQLLASFGMPEETLVLIDTPPGPSVYLQQTLRVAHFDVVTVLPDAGSFATMPIIDRVIAKYGTQRSDFLGSGYLVNQIDPGKRLSRDVLERLRQDLGSRLLGAIHQDQAVSEALASALTVRSYAPHSQAAQDISECADRLVERLAIAEPSRWRPH